MFKLLPAAQDLFICLHCQYRLSLRQGLRSGRRRPTGHPQQLRRFTSGPSLRQEQSSYPDVATDNDNLERAPIRYYTEEFFPHQNYRHGNEPSTKDSLGLNVLGEPAEVLILRDKQDRFRLDTNMARVRASGPDKNPAQKPISSSEMLEEMDAERGLIDIDEVCKNIESVGESWAAKKKGSITGVAYKDLVSRLQEGFTKHQLGAYLERAGKDPAADVFDLNVEISNSLYTRSSWQLVGNTPLRQSKAPRIANSTPEEESNEKEVHGKERGQGLSKDALVKRILRRCWNITPRYQESSLGELDVRLHKLHLDLILNHKRDILKLISRSYDSKVEAWPGDCIIRITSDYDNCVDIFKLLIHTLENIRVSTIDLRAHSISHEGSTSFPRELNNAMLRQIEEYTNTLVRPQGVAHQKLHVFYLGPDDADLLETERLIHQILRPASTRNLTLAWSKADKPSNAIPAPVAVGSRLSLLDRNQQWSRWCSPHTENRTQRRKKKDGAPSSSSSTVPATQGMHGKLAFDTVKSFFEESDDTSYKYSINITPYWTPEIRCHDSVKLGQVLFPADKAGNILEALERNQRRTKKMKSTGHRNRPIDTGDIVSKSLRIPREFVPLVPGLVRSLGSLGSLEKTEDFWQIRLSPSSKNVSLPVPVEALPDLEIRMSFDHENKTTSIKDVRLVNEKEKDFLQPQKIVDLRFVRKQCVYAKDDSIDPRIVSFVQDSNFDIWGTERLKTPLGISLSIPALAIQSHKDFDPKKHESLLVDYTSLGLEHRSSLIMPYQESDSWSTLTYTSVEAGRVGGRRDELSLHNLRQPSIQPPPTDPEPFSAISIDNDPESLSDDDHTSILFHKTASLIESIELAASDQSDKPVDRRKGPVRGLSMPELRHWRGISPRKLYRRIGFSPDTGYLPPVNETVRRVAADHRSGGRERAASGNGTDWI